MIISWLFPVIFPLDKVIIYAKKWKLSCDFNTYFWRLNPNGRGREEMVNGLCHGLTDENGLDAIETRRWVFSLRPEIFIPFGVTGE
jgi:hypothetical protein